MPEMWRVWLLPCLALSLLIPAGEERGTLAGQSTELDAVENHMASGRFPEAREGLEQWWGGESVATREERQQALWLRARLTVDPELAELDYRRLVVEYPGGPWSDAALMRLAQGAEFRGDDAAARQYLEILVRDYPASPHRVEARDRMVRLDAPRTTTGQRSERLPAPVPPILPESQEEAPPPAPYTVQLGAFSSSDNAGALADRARSEGLDVRVTQVEGSPLFRVRMGGFPSRVEAEQAAELPRQLGFEVVLGSDGNREVSPD
ncbi:MAG: hypothetical protein EA421_06640 [Gemmatimonadales bacterium]|nr:MAG: hypothetical protein EA421_06640 [Gemmatimonadales bacterium]